MGPETRRLAAVARPGEMTENVGIFFVGGDASGGPVEVACATSGTVSNMPYAPDDAYSFTASLFELADAALLVCVAQEQRSGDSLQKAERLLLSTDGGRSWKSCSPAQLAGLPRRAELMRLEQ